MLLLRWRVYKLTVLFIGILILPNAYGYASFRDQQSNFTRDLYKEVFSETEIFYAPGSNEAVPLISKSTGLTDRSPKGVYGWLPCFCFIEACSCCVDVQIRSLNIRDTGCITLSPSNYDTSSVDAGLALNNRTLIEERISFENAPPLCIPFPPFPAISICVRLNQIMRDGRNIKACVNFELRITGTLNPLWTLQFTCVRFGFSGISFFRPTTSPTTVPTISLLQQQQQEKGQNPQQQQQQQQPDQHQHTRQENPQLSLFVVQPYVVPPLQPVPLPLQIPASAASVPVLVDDPSPLCAPFPNFPLISGCIHFNRIRTDNGRIRGCARMEIRVSGTEAILWGMQFSCFRIGTDGIVFNRPNKNKVKPNEKPIDEPIKEPSPSPSPMKRPDKECDG